MADPTDHSRRPLPHESDPICIQDQFLPASVAGNSYAVRLHRPMEPTGAPGNHVRMEPPHSSALRRGRWSEAGRIYLETLVAGQRKAIFSDWETAAPVARLLSSPDTWLDSRLLCWVLMPNHWHGLLELGHGESLSQNIGRAKAAVSRTWTQELGHPASPWQPGFHDRALRAEDELLDAARYVVANPLRAGLVQRLADYPYWNAVWL